MRSTTPKRLAAQTVCVFAAITAAAIWERSPSTPVRACAAAAAAALVLLLLVPFRARSPWEWARLALRRERLREGVLYGHDGVAVVWDGRRAHAYVELHAKPYENSVITAAGRSPLSAVPMNALRAGLEQFDIRLDSITLINAGRAYGPDSPAARAYRAGLGPVPALLTARTLVQVTVDFAASIGAVKARAGKAATGEGLGRTVAVCARRVHRHLRAAGQECRVLPPSEVRSFHDMAAAQLREPLRAEHWRSAGREGRSAAAFLWRKDGFNAARQSARLSVPASFVATAVKLSRGERGDQARGTTVYTSETEKEMRIVEQYGLDRATGQQAAAMSSVMPLVAQSPNLAGKPIPWPSDGEFPALFWPQGAGTLVGHTAAREPVFVNFLRGDPDEPFQIIGPEHLTALLVLRVAAAGTAVDVRLDGAEWPALLTALRCPNARVARRPSAEVVFCPADQAHAVAAETGGAGVVGVGSAAPPRPPKHALVARGGGLELVDGKTRHELRWLVSAQEEALIRDALPDSKPAQRQPSLLV